MSRQPSPRRAKTKPQLTTQPATDDTLRNGEVAAPHGPAKRTRTAAELVYVEDAELDLDAWPADAERDAASQDDAAESLLAQTDLDEFFGPNGPLAQVLEGYEARPSQVEMAKAVKQALLDPAVALIEAPTGTGKSIAYLLPAILSGKTVVVATANKSLQHQLYTKDIPFLRRVLNQEIRAVVVKGRSNYVCTYKWEREAVEQQRIALYDRLDDQLPQIAAWLEETDTGDVDDLPFTINADLRPRIVSYPDDCLHRDCRFYNDQCWVNLMRDEAASAQIIITNHHLLLNALELGFAGERILPPAAVYIIDEAHQLEQTATAVYETVVTDYTVEQLLARSVFREHVDEDELDRLRLQNTLAFQEASNLSRENAYRIDDELEEMRKLGNSLRDLAQRLKARSPYRQEGANASHDARFDDEPRFVPANGDDESEARRAYELGIEGLNSTAAKLIEVATAGRQESIVRFAVRIFDRRRVSLELHAAPINPAAFLHQSLFHPENEGEAVPRTVICTSATLATNGHFAHFKTRCGIHTTSSELVLAGVFDYPGQALLYQPALPAFTPQTSSAYYDRVADEIARLVEVSRGRTLCLFTSWSGLQQVSDRLQPPGGGLIWPMRTQGDAPRNALLEWFLETDHSVLLATRSFWEGVDIPGDDLSLVVVDKLPFPTPNDPLHNARMRALEEEGRSSFGEYMLPLMTLTLKQGFGRLIRRSSDKGVVAILDSRLHDKGYGRQARRDLPPATYSRAFADVHRFYQGIMQSRAEFALNVWVRPAPNSGLADLDLDFGAPNDSLRWRWQLLRLQDGKADQAEGMTSGVAPEEAELQAMIAGLSDLQRRVEQAKRSPRDFAVEVRCSLPAAEYAITHKPPAWQAVRYLWRTVDFVCVKHEPPTLR